MIWDFLRRPRFKKQFKNLDPQIKQRILKSLSELANSENPAEFGTYKVDMKVFAINIGKYRIIYVVDYLQRKIVLLRVCDHKSAYGKD